MVMTEAEQRAWWAWSHRKTPSPDEARIAGWVERDGRWQTADRWLHHDRLINRGYLEVLPDYYVKGSLHTDAVALVHETIADFSNYPTD